jgi:hypothetical protein
LLRLATGPNSKSGAAVFDSLATRACFARMTVRAAVWCDSRWVITGHLTRQPF